MLVEEGIQVLVLGRWSAEAEALVERWQQAGILVLVFLIAEASEYANRLPDGNQFVEITSNLQSSSKNKFKGKMKAAFSRSPNKEIS